MGREEKTVYGEATLSRQDGATENQLYSQGLSVDYEEEYSKYLMQEVSFEPRDNDDFMALLRLLERWHKKSVPQILEKNKPDAAYAIAMALCKHIPLLINRDDIQELVGEYKRRIGKLIFDSYQALVEAVKIWNHEEKRQEVCRYIKETAGQYPNHRGMKKKLMDLMPEIPFEGEPMAVTREPNNMGNHSCKFSTTPIMKQKQ